ncbi:MAG TPA: VWA domain-containing protein [Phycisphaerales bacterium]|nr:VWA domain-containing protein [Phycisphaerales bacterium]
MRMEAGWVWFALPLLLLWVLWFWRKSYAQLDAGYRTASVLLRVCIAALLIAALARPIFERTTGTQHLLYLLDVSRSVSKDNLEAALADIDRLAKEASGKGHRASVVLFGERPRILVDRQKDWSGWTDAHKDLVAHESQLTALNTQLAKLVTDNAPEQDRAALQQRVAAIESFRKEVVGEQTDARAALRLAMNSGEVGEGRAVYLFTDANFNRGDWQETYRAALDAGCQLHTVALDKPMPAEVAAAELTLPSGLRINQGFTAELRVASTVATPARLVVYRDGFAIAEESRQLKPGENTIALPGLYFREKGFHTIDVAVRAEQDTRVENNRVRAVAVVPGEMRVLYVDSDEAQQSYLSSALGLEGVQVETRPASGVPSTLDDLLGFDAFILSNVPADRLTQRQMQMVRTYVQDFGGGFVMLGGDQSFGLGGYFNTPIEEVLPVRMPIQKDLNRPSLAIVLVIDKSGSMEGVKIQLAKRAAVATAEAINPRDQIGVVGFDSEAEILLELTSAGDRATINDRISSLEAGGGTFLYPGMEDAHTMLQQSSARKKHVIILSDGQTQGFGYPDIAQLMASDGITISTVGIGEGADQKLLEQIAGAGGGRAYFTNDFYSIPQIFTREALRASNSMLVERLVVVSQMTDDESLEEIDVDELPPLGGYVATSAREAAKTILISDAGDPILAKWRYGLGRSAAFTSDTKPRWAEDWIRWPEFAKLWAQIVRSVAGRDVMKDIEVEVAHEERDDAIRLTADLRDPAGNFVTDRVLELMSYDPQAGAKAVEVKREAPGLFSAVVPRGEYGRSHQFAWRLPDVAANPDGESATVPFGYVQSFSPEFRTLGVSTETLDQITARSLGDVARVGQVALKLPEKKSTEQLRLWPWLLMGALCLVPFDILVRRIG